MNLFCSFAVFRVRVPTGDQHRQPSGVRREARTLIRHSAEKSVVRETLLVLAVQTEGETRDCGLSWGRSLEKRIYLSWRGRSVVFTDVKVKSAVRDVQR